MCWSNLVTRLATPDQPDDLDFAGLILAPLATGLSLGYHQSENSDSNLV